jgi:hypothetical protein
VISEQQRRAALGNFPIGTPVLVVAPAASGFAGIVRERNDPAVTFVELGSDAAVTPMPHLLLEGLDDINKPEQLLRAVREAMPATRIFALIANAANFTAIQRFLSGEQIARGHPLTHGEIGPLFTAAGWQILGIRPLYDQSIPVMETVPVRVTIANFGVDCTDPAMYERVRTAGYSVIADPAT